MASAIGSSTRRAWMANSSSRRVPPPKSTWKAALWAPTKRK